MRNLAVLNDNEGLAQNAYRARGPYLSLNVSQCWYSGTPFGGRFKTLPTVGSGLGPGGRGGPETLRKMR